MDGLVDSLRLPRVADLFNEELFGQTAALWWF
jgi:hypothetical protein